MSTGPLGEQPAAINKTIEQKTRVISQTLRDCSNCSYSGNENALLTWESADQLAQTVQGNLDQVTVKDFSSLEAIQLGV